MVFLSQKSKRGVHTSFYFTKFCRPWPCSEQTGVLLEMLFSVWSLKAQHKGLQWRLECRCKMFKKWKSRSFRNGGILIAICSSSVKKYKNTCSPPGQKWGQIVESAAIQPTFCNFLLKMKFCGPAFWADLIWTRGCLNFLHRKPNLELDQSLFQDLKIGPSRLWSLRAGITILSSSRAWVGPAGFINLALEKLYKLGFWNRQFKDTIICQFWQR